MVQLTLPCCGVVTGVPQVVAALSDDWRGRLGDGAHLVEAARATRAQFAGWCDRDLSPRERQRVSAYFGACVRRSVMRSADPCAREARRRLLAASIEADLRNAGWDASRASEEATRVLCGSSARGDAA